MTDYIRPDILNALTQDRALPVTQSFIDTVNREASDKPDTAVVDAVAQGAIVAIASLEIKLGKLMDALGAQETQIAPGNWDVRTSE